MNGEASARSATPTRTSIWTVVLLLMAACQRERPGTSERAQAQSQSAAGLSTPSASAAPAAASWFEGSWQGHYTARVNRIELPEPKAQELAWSETQGSDGEGSLSLSIDPQGQLRGESTGALGNARLTGQVEAQRLVLRFRAEGDETTGFWGTAVLNCEMRACSGTLKASMGNSLSVRDAQITLERWQ